MKCKLRKTKFIIFLLFWSLNSFAQTIFNGNIKDSNKKPIVGITVILTLPNSQSIMAFATTKTDGKFSIKLNKNVDTISITAKSLEYETQTFVLKNISQEVNFLMEAKTQELKEVVVKAPPIRKLGDTLSYNVSSFRTETDRTIGDIIQKLPGIEMDANGQIKYMGNPINTYYVEGLDLMKGRYGIINQNLAVDHVSSVEVFEKHQKIRALEGVKTPETAALNIKLKKSVTASYTLELGLGAIPALYDVNATSLVFMPKLQSVVSYQSNNSGKNIRNQLIDHHSNDGRLRGIPSSSNWLNVRQITLPPTNPERWLDNNSHLGTLNVLKPLKNNLQLTINTGLTLDKIKQSGNSTQTYKIDNDIISFNEKSDNLLKYNALNGALTFEKNTKKIFFTNILSFNKEWSNNSGINLRPEITYNQKLEGGNETFSNQFRTTLNKGNQIYQVYSNLSFSNNNHLLDVSINGKDTLENPSQNLSIKTWNSHNYLEFIRKINQFNINFSIGNQFSLHNLDSRLYDFPGITDALNEISWKNSSTYFKASTNYKFKKGIVVLEIPLQYQTIQYQNFEAKSSFNKFNSQPMLFVRKDILKHLSISLSSKYANPLSKFGEMYNQYIMLNYLNLSKNQQPFRNDHSFTNSIILNYENSSKGTMAFLNYTHNLLNSNILATNTISEGGLNSSNNFQKNNDIIRNTFSGKASKFYFDINLTPTIGFVYSTNQQSSFLNENIIKFKNSYISPYLNLKYSGLKRADFDYQLTFSKNQYQSNTNTSLSQNLNTNFRISKSTYLKTKMEYVKNEVGNGVENIFFGDLTLLFRIKKYDLEFNLKNIFNQDTYRSINASDYYYAENVYQLRPRQFMIKGKINI